MKKISLIIPVYNEEENIKMLESNVINFINKKFKNRYIFEIIIIDNCSTDRTYEYIKQISNNYPNVFGYKLSKNYGYQKSIWTGYSLCKGDAAIVYDSDFQDPIELIDHFLNNWEKNYKIVYGIRSKRSDNFFITFLIKTFYKIFFKLSNSEVPQNVGDFLLIDKIIIDKIKNYHNHFVYLRGLIFSFGYSHFGLEYHRNRRLFGKSKFSIFKYFEFALSAILGNTNFSLLLMSFLTLILASFTIFLFLFYFFTKILSLLIWPPGLITILLLILIMMIILTLSMFINFYFLIKISSNLENKDMTVIIDKTTND